MEGGRLVRRGNGVCSHGAFNPKGRIRGYPSIGQEGMELVRCDGRVCGWRRGGGVQPTLQSNVALRDGASCQGRGGLGANLASPSLFQEGVDLCLLQVAEVSDFGMGISGREG